MPERSASSLAPVRALFWHASYLVFALTVVLWARSSVARDHVIYTFKQDVPRAMVRGVRGSVAPGFESTAHRYWAGASAGGLYVGWGTWWEEEQYGQRDTSDAMPAGGGLDWSSDGRPEYRRIHIPQTSMLHRLGFRWFSRVELSAFPAYRIEQRELIAPFWAVCIVTSVAPLWHLHGRAKIRRRSRRGRCPRCGYDMRATPGRCPECGGEGIAKAVATKADAAPV